MLRFLRKQLFFRYLCQNSDWYTDIFVHTNHHAKYDYDYNIFNSLGSMVLSMLPFQELPRLQGD